ncbi:hypothetical protein Bca4012_051919 [Brassica carinata]|uniref:(rape) hypothetical protein n=1 Tax=Brassica napus TaxID=3708 RepID=A0A078HKF2_BRANA|nr:unnamed protein product [Brassica napus]CDY37343.1 BnaC02g33610D [Brassica napus]
MAIDSSVSLTAFVLPLRLTISELRSLSNASSVPTFLPSHSLSLLPPIRFISTASKFTSQVFSMTSISLSTASPIFSSSADRIGRNSRTAPLLCLLWLIRRHIRRHFHRHICHRQGARGGFHRRQRITLSFFWPYTSRAAADWEVPVSQPPLEDLIVGDGDSWTTGF